VHDVWRAGAPPSISWRRISTSSRLPRFAPVSTGSGNPLFHSRNRAGGGRRGQNSVRFRTSTNAIGFSPFGVDGGRAARRQSHRQLRLISQLTPLDCGTPGQRHHVRVLLNPNDHRGKSGWETYHRGHLPVASHPGAPVAAADASRGGYLHCDGPTSITWPEKASP